MTEMKNMTYPKKAAEKALNSMFNDDEKEIEQIDIDHLLYDVMIIKAESLKNRKIFKYAEYLEKKLLNIKNNDAKLDLGVPLK